MTTNKLMNMRMDPETLKQIDAQAELEHRDRSGMIRHMIATYLEYRMSGPPWLDHPITGTTPKGNLCGNPVHAGYKGRKFDCIDCRGGIYEPEEYAKGKVRRKQPPK